MLHGHVSRGMFNGLWPAFDEAEVPIGSITNGVHAPTWVAPRGLRARRRARAPTLESDDAEAFWTAVDKVPGADIWATKRQLRERLVVDARSGWPLVARSAARPRPSWAGSTRRSTPTC